MDAIPIGQPLPNYRCLIHDEFGQHVIVGQQGELLIGGVGVFAGYLGRDDLTSKVLVEIEDETYYKTGDLVRMDRNGLIYYNGRKDYQVKLHGQRIEVGEIEQCLLGTHIVACVVMKYEEDYLIAYVQSSDINEENLRTYCRTHLPPFMIPSMFIILEQLPLNANGKVDRKRLPIPDFSSLSVLTTSKYDAPRSEIEQRVHDVWCEVLQPANKKISTTAGFFTIGGHSLLLIQLYHQYQSLFGFDSQMLGITPFLQQTTISEHAKLLESIQFIAGKSKEWQTLHINEGAASFAQERIFLDEQIRFSDNVAVYNVVAAFRLINGSLSVERLQRAIQSVLKKHQILRTSIFLDRKDGILKQRIEHSDETFTCSTEQVFSNDEELNMILRETIISKSLFDLSNGCVVNCQILRHAFNGRSNDNDVITSSDVLIFAFHHAAFDGASNPIFFKDLCMSYNTDTQLTIDEYSLQYIDYSAYERQMDMTASRDFWRSQMNGYDYEHHLSLPVDRHRSSANERSSFEDNRLIVTLKIYRD
ncbi:unnamed protein product [Rotaria sp. Silwood2]|nr:unnamed protein product [Rotaria sp. Silwood2]